MPFGDLKGWNLNASVLEGRLDCMSIIFVLFILNHLIVVLDVIAYILLLASSGS